MHPIPGIGTIFVGDGAMQDGIHELFLRETSHFASKVERAAQSISSGSKGSLICHPPGIGMREARETVDGDLGKLLLERAAVKDGG